MSAHISRSDTDHNLDQLLAQALIRFISISHLSSAPHFKTSHTISNPIPKDSLPSVAKRSTTSSRSNSFLGPSFLFDIDSRNSRSLSIHHYRRTSSEITHFTMYERCMICFYTRVTSHTPVWCCLCF